MTKTAKLKTEALNDELVDLLERHGLYDALTKGGAIYKATNDLLDAAAVKFGERLSPNPNED